jgi:hypothetical protein
MSLNSKLSLLAALLLVTAGAQAQTKKELVQKVIALQTPAVESLGRAVATQTSGQVMQAVAQGLQRVPADKREATAKLSSSRRRRWGPSSKRS